MICHLMQNSSGKKYHTSKGKFLQKEKRVKLSVLPSVDTNAYQNTQQPTFSSDGCAKYSGSPTDINAIAPYNKASVLVIEQWFIEFPARELLCTMAKIK